MGAMKRRGLVKLIAGSVAAWPLAARAEPPSTGPGAQSIIGSWLAVPAAAGRPPVPLLLTFGSDGTVLRSTALGGRSTGHGVWISTGQNSVTYTLMFLRYNAAFDFVGSTKDRVQLTLDPALNEFSGSGKFDVIDVQGTLERSRFYVAWDSYQSRATWIRRRLTHGPARHFDGRGDIWPRACGTSTS